MALIKELESEIKSKDDRITDVELSYSEAVDEYTLMNSYGLNLQSIFLLCPGI